MSSHIEPSLVRVNALRRFRDRIADLNTVLYTDLDQGRPIRVRDLVEAEIARVQEEGR